MATGVNNTLMGLVHQMAELTVSEEQEKMPLEKYFPHPFKIHDYNPTENKIIRTSFLDDDIKDWLRKPSNNNFVFQCLLCSQEMNFKTVFLRGSYFLNRSHLLTKKHTKNVKDVSCVGVLFVSSRKFVMCLESMLENGQIFNAMKNIKRRDELLINNLIKNKIFCYNYSMFTFDIASKSLCEMEMKCDIVQFMIHYIRPLFNFHCLLCDIKSSSFTQVVNHLQGRKHIKKLKGSKGVIISIRDFNIFVSCNLDELSSFLFLDHLNSYLEEIVIASAGTILISGCHSKEGKPVPKYGEIKINVKPIELPNGVKLEKSVKVTTRFNNFLTDLSDDEISNNKLSTAESRISRQKNVTIYEYSSQDFEDHCMDNIIHALITIGCRIWCSRCKKGIYTLQALQAHLSSLEHTKNMRNNEQVGFMCHVCKIFYIELKGECLVHTHSSHQNKIIIKKLSEGAMKSLEYITPLNNSIIKAYGSFLDNIAEAYKFCCLACNDYIKQKLMYLGYHEINDCHKKLPGALFYTLCEYCNVIYIDSQPDWKFGQFKLHFAKHLDDSKGPITYRFYSMVDNYTTCFQTSISSNFFSFKDISLLEKTEPFNGEKLTVSFSKNFTQFDNPGVCSTEFEKCEKWNNDTFFKYIQLYTTLTGKQIKFFECSICNLKKATKTEIFNHLFVSQHQYNQLYMKESFLKICDICDLAILSGNILNLQQHFTDSSHIKELSTVMGLPNTDALTFAKANLTSFMNISRSSLNELIEETTREMKDTYINHHIVFEWLTKDILSLMSHKFPNLSVTFYGSRLSGLATSKSDFDILLNLENKGNDFLDHVKDLLDTENNYFKLKEYISPVIRTEHKNTGYVCEFNLNNPVEHVYNSKIIKIFTDLDDRVLSLLAAVKQWSTATKIRGSSMFSSHAINWLVLFYLMQPDLRIIPNVSFVMSQYDLKSDGVEGCILQWETKINKDKTWLELLEGFFNYYSFMKFSEYKLFPFSGIAVPRIQGVNEDDCPMYMQDPFNKDRNILFNATKDKSDKLTAQCYHSLHLPWRLNA